MIVSSCLTVDGMKRYVFGIWLTYFHLKHEWLKLSRVIRQTSPREPNSDVQIHPAYEGTFRAYWWRMLTETMDFLAASIYCSRRSR